MRTKEDIEKYLSRTDVSIETKLNSMLYQFSCLPAELFVPLGETLLNRSDFIPEIEKTRLRKKIEALERSIAGKRRNGSHC